MVTVKCIFKANPNLRTEDDQSGVDSRMVQTLYRHMVKRQNGIDLLLDNRLPLCYPAEDLYHFAFHQMCKSSGYTDAKDLPLHPVTLKFKHTVKKNIIDPDVRLSHFCLDDKKRVLVSCMS